VGAIAPASFQEAIASINFTSDDRLCLAASLGQGSEHPLAEALRQQGASVMFLGRAA